MKELNIIDEKLISKPNVDFRILIILLLLFLFAFIFRSIDSGIISFLGISSLAITPSWAFVMFQRCKKNHLVKYLVIFGIFIHLYFIYDVAYPEVSRFLKYGVFDLKYFYYNFPIICFYPCAILSYIIFSRIRLSSPKPVFTKKNKA